MSSVHFLIGKTLGKYQILEHLGHGGMSEVYKGQQAQLDRMVAIKVLHPFLADEEGFVVRFQREARIVATLRHPNIVQVYDFDYNEDLALYYMVMEYIDGPTLKDLLNDRPLSPLETARIGAAIADALGYAHQRNMVHRDIKPANIMFIEDQQPVLTDFGIAKMLTLSGLTASGAMVGTPAYMAPEVGIGKAGTAYSDLYSLGVVLFQAVTGRLPFDAETPMGMVMQHINDPAPMPSQFVPDLPEQMEQVIMRALEKRPEERFTDGEEMALLLRTAVGLDTAKDTPPVGSRFELPIPPSQIQSFTEIPANKAVEDEQALDETPMEEDRLLRSWKTLSHRSAEEDLDASALPADTQRDREAQHTFTVRQQMLRASLMLIMLLFVGGAIWFGIAGGMPELLRTALGLEPVDAVPAGATALGPQELEISSVPMAGATSTPAFMETTDLTPETSPTPQTTCQPQIRLGRARIEPSATVGPEAAIIAYVTIYNNGNCVWSDGGILQMANEDVFGISERFAIKPLAPGENVQVVIPMKAPEEPGTYLARWEVQTLSGDPVGSQLPLELTVSETAAATPTPMATLAAEVTPSDPLTLLEPQIITWEDDSGRNRWTGVVQVQAQGGSGYYDYYQGEVREDTRLIDGTMAFEGRRCEALSLNLWILSGEDTLHWQGQIPYPDMDSCR